MKRTLQLLLVVSFVAMFLVSPVAAATSQGLEWGVALDDEFTYQMTVTEESVTTIDEGINVTILSTPPTINDPLTNWTHIDVITLNMTFYNGTEIGILAFALIGLYAIGGLFAIPTGNYSLLTELAMADSFWDENVTLIDNALYWGITWTGMDADEELSVTGEYLKADGFVSRYIFEVTNTTSSVSSSVSMIRDNLPVLTTTTTGTNSTSTGFDIVGFVTDNILYIGVGIAVLLVLVICIKRR